MARRTHEQAVKEYLKEYDRIRKQISRMKKRGYDVTGIQPERKAKKDITSKDLAKLKKLTNKKIYEKAEYQGFSGEFMRKAEQHEAAKKAAETKRKRKERPPVPPEPTEPPKPPQPPAPPTIPGEDGLTDEEQAAIDRFYDIVNMFEKQIRDDMNSWASRLRAKLGDKKFAGMIARAIEGGLVIEYRPPSQQPMYAQFIMQEINTYLPPDMDEQDRQDAEDDWDNIIDMIADDEDFFPFD